MIMNIYFNEYHIKTRDRIFWKCNDCGHYANHDYYYHPDGYWAWEGHWSERWDRLYFYDPNVDGSKNNLYKYHFDFIIDNIDDL